MCRPVLLLALIGVIAPWVGRVEAETESPWRECLLPRVELSAERNALTRWRPLFPRLVPESSVIAGQLQALSSPLDDDAGLYNDPELKAWLAAAAPVLSELVLLENEEFQLPALHGPETPFPDHHSLRQLAVVRLALMKTTWLEGRHEAALQLSLDNLALARAMLSTQEGLIPLIQANGLWQLALDGIYWLVRQGDLPKPIVIRLQAALANDDRLATDALIRAFRGEFTFFTRVVIDRLPQTRDVDLLLSSIGSLGMAPPLPPAEGEPRLATPPDGREPFDREATLQAAADDVAGWIAAFGDPRHPRGLSATHTYRRLRGYAEELGALLRYATQEEVPTPEQIDQANAIVAHIENPVGKLFLVIATSQWEPISVTVFRREAQRRALIGLLAWRVHGRPATWSDLIAAGVLVEPPQDPFGEGALRLDLDVPRLWSVGVDGVDDGGEGNGDNLGLPPDFTWPLPLDSFSKAAKKPPGRSGNMRRRIR